MDDPTPNHQPIDWSGLRPYEGPTDRADARAISGTGDSNVDELGTPIDAPAMQGGASLDLLGGEEPLDPQRQRVPLADLYPDRLESASTAEVERLSEAVRTLDDYQWVRSINPGADGHMRAGLVGRTENCADCARSVQSTLDGRPLPAASIDARGLPLADHPASGGEAVDYTEHWAGRRAEPSDYDDVGERLRTTQGSAIVFIEGQSGHATNAVFDAPSGKVLWLDGQIGIVADWPPPDDVRERFPRARAIFFDPTEPRRAS